VLRVVAGHYGGRRLVAPRGSSTRPTAERVREALFSMLGPLEDARVLDLFAGSGALGIESLSRGANEAVFVEPDRRALEAIRANLRTVGADQSAQVIPRQALAYLPTEPLEAEARFDLVFIDPPYSSAPQLAGPLSERLPLLLRPDARIVTESDKRTPLELSLPLAQERVYGDTRIAIHRGA